VIRRPLLLDLFCCEGGAATGYHRAGFDVIGVDINPQPLYPFKFIQADALDYVDRYVRANDVGMWHGPWFDAVHASPPCQSYSTMSNRHGSDEPELIAPTRDILKATGLPYVIENVTGARSHMRSPMALHGGQLGMTVYRPRLFESNILLTPPPKAPIPKNPVAVYGRQPGNGRLLWTRTDGTHLRAATLEEAREAMGMPWASWNGCREAIPPAYTEFIGRQLLAHVNAEVAA
jgi:DNA (cytosine-5)-methyltransferase 1